MNDPVTVELDRLRWAEVLMALAKAESDENASEKARHRWGVALDEIKDQTHITATDLVELQEGVYRE